MKDSLLLIMTPNMSLEKWDALGQLSREFDFYQGLCRSAGWKLIIFSYGRNDKSYLKGYSDFEVLNMPQWIPARLPFRLQNLIYHFVALFIFRRFFKRVIISKTNQFDASGFGLLLKFWFSIPLIIRMGYYHSHFKQLKAAKRIREFISFNLCDRIIVTSTEAGEFIADKYSVSKQKILCIHNSINLSLFKPREVHKKYDLIFVGRLEKVKNIELLIKVIDRLNLKALIIGNGSLSDKVTELVSRNQNVVWEKRVNNSDLPDYYSQSKLFVILSHYEGNPKALLEAMACGVPCIGTNVPGIRDCINHDYNGILVDENIGSVINGVIYLLSNPYKAYLLSNNATKWVRSNCNVQRNITKELTFYTSLSKVRLTASLP